MLGPGYYMLLLFIAGLKLPKLINTLYLRCHMETDFFKVITELGFPIAAACASGYFVFLTIKFILAGVTSSVYSMNHIVRGLDDRIDTMTDELQRLDVKISQSLGLDPDYGRISRAERVDHRRD
jgi:hypothetical protein